MHTVGMKMLRDELATYVAQARAGERIIITDRGEAVAELAPLSPELRLARHMVTQGRARWSGRRPALRGSGVVIRGLSVSDAVIEDRDDSVP
jgi:prevent-host-death family protein